MRKITKEYEVYTLDEVKANEDLKAKVLEKHRYFNVEDIEWYDCIISDYEIELNKAGFHEVKIDFSGFWSQGDGASFTSAYLDFYELAQAVNADETINENFTNRELGIIKSLTENCLIEGKIERHNSHYVHAHSVSLEYDDGQLLTAWKHINALSERLENVADALRYRFCVELYRDLEHDYEYLTSDEAIFESLDGNEYEFYADGSIC